MNGKMCMAIERRNSVSKRIREMERERIEIDTLNYNKFKDLYDILAKLNKEIVEEWMKLDQQKKI